MYSMIAVLCLAVIIAANPGERVKRADGRCVMEGKTYENGQRFTTEFSGPCVQYLCKDGAATPDILSCEDKDHKCGYKNGDKVPRSKNGASYNCTCHIDAATKTISYINCLSG